MTLLKGTISPYLLLLVILLIAYLPVSTLHFALKNDAFSDNFPNKFFLSESLHSGFLPLWNPYLNFGFPVYADPGFAFFNPITWFFAGIIGYNAYSLTVEVLVYIYLAGVSMYRLGRHLRFTITTAIAISAMYMCSGFFVGELQHINFITSAAFLPFLMQRFLMLSEVPDYKNACIAAFSYYIVIAGGHPAIPIGTIYFLFTLSLSILVLNQNARQHWKAFVWYHSVSVVLVAILYLPAIYSYSTILPAYGRGMPADQLTDGAMQTGFSFSSYLSFLYPFATTKNASYFTDDLAMRNGYFSVAGFALLLTQLTNKNYVVRSLLIGSLVMLALSWGGTVKPVIYSHLPFLNYVRTNGEFRVFGILCFCIIAGFAFNRLQQNKEDVYIPFRKILQIILVFSIGLLCYLLIKNGSELNFFLNNDPNKGAIGIKHLIDGLTFSHTLFISAAINILVVSTLLVTKTNLKRISVIVIVELAVNSIIYLPFSGVGVVTLAEVQSNYNKSPKGIPMPPLVKIRDTDTLPAKRTGLIGSWSYYNKQIGITTLQDYPSYFSNTASYFDSDLPKTINKHSYVFMQSDANTTSQTTATGKSITIKSFSPQKIKIEITAPENDSLILLQNHYRFWQAKVDGKITPVKKSYITFMSVPVNKGSHLVEFSYHDPLLFVFIVVSLLVFITLSISLFRSRRNQLRLK